MRTMKGIFRTFLLAALLWLTPSAPSAAPVSLFDTQHGITGVFSQGGLAWGKAQPNSTVYLNDLQITAGNDGTFVVPFDRQLAGAPTLRYTRPDGTAVRATLSIAQRTYITQHIRGVPPSMVAISPEDQRRIAADSAAINASRAVATDMALFREGFINPVPSGRVSGVYGSRRTFNGQERSWHRGLDLAAPTGTPVAAPANGRVVLARADSFFNGNLIIIDHGRGVFTIYAHLHTMGVQVGDTVTRGQTIATVGSTGRSTGPHLHWGLYWHNMALDPQLFLRERS